MGKLFIPVILGTARKDRESEKVSNFVLEQVRDFGFETELVDVVNHTFGKTIPPWEGNEDTKPWRELAEKSDGFIIVSPEYNHGYPGELKLFLDSAYDEYVKKPVMICSVSSGGFGGARMVDHLKQVLVELQMVPLRNAVFFSKVGELFDDGGIKDKSFEENTSKMLKELEWYANALKKAKE